MFPSSVKSEQLLQVSDSSGAVRSLPRAAAAASSLGATLSPPLRGGRSPGRGGERGGSLHLAVNIIYLLAIAPLDQWSMTKSSGWSSSKLSSILLPVLSTWSWTSWQSREGTQAIKVGFLHFKVMMLMMRSLICWKFANVNPGRCHDLFVIISTDNY